MTISNSELAARLQTVADGWQAFVVQQIAWITSEAPTVVLFDPQRPGTSFTAKTLRRIIFDFDALFGPSSTAIVDTRALLQSAITVAGPVEANATAASQARDAAVAAAATASGASAGIVTLRNQTEAFRNDAQSAASSVSTSVATSAANAAASATSATNAGNSETLAGTSRTAAETAATAAGTSATAGAGSAASASTSAANADTARSSAVVARVAAEAANTTAGTAATNAGDSATAAGTSATNAGNSATAAGTSATAANTSRIAAQTAQTAAEAARDSAQAIVGSGGTATDAQLRDRATHTGAQPASTISDFAVTVAATAAVVANTAKESNATHTGEVTGAVVLTIANDAVTNAKLSNMATATLKGRATAATGDPEDLTAAQARLLLDVAAGATANATDAQLRDRATHTGSQPMATIIDLAPATIARTNAVNVFDQPQNFYSGLSGAQVINQRFGWSIGLNRWATIIESNANYSLWSYASGNGSATRRLMLENAIGGNELFVGAVNITYGGSTVWHAGNTTALADALSLPGSNRLVARAGRRTAAELQSTTLPSGLYSNSGEGMLNAAGNAVALPGWWHIAHSHHDVDGYASQIATELASDQRNQMFMRTSDRTVWREWTEIFHSGNTLNIGATAVTARSALNVADGATANATDAQLRDRGTHTGSQLASTISDLSPATIARTNAHNDYSASQRFRVGANGTWQPFQAYGWMGTGVDRWWHVLETDGSITWFSFDASGGNLSRRLQLDNAVGGNTLFVGAVNVTYGGSTVWHAGNTTALADALSLPDPHNRLVARAGRRTATELQSTTLAAGLYANSGDGLLNAAGGVAFGGWWHVAHSYHDVNGFASQIATELSSGNRNQMLMRSSHGTAWKEWTEIFHSGNFNPAEQPPQRINGGPLLTQEGGQLRVEGTVRTFTPIVYLTANHDAWLAQPRVFVGGANPGAQAANGDVWIG